MFTSGKVAMYYGGSWDPVAIADVPAAKAFTEVAPLPKGADRRQVLQQRPRQLDLRQYPASRGGLGVRQVPRLQARQRDPGRTGTVISAYNGQAGSLCRGLPWMNAQALIDQLPDALPFPVSENTPAWRRNATAEFAKAWTGEETVEAVANRVAQQMNDALAAE